MYLKYFPVLEQVLFTANLEIQWKNYRDKLNDAVLHNLAFCSELLSSLKNETIIEEDEIIDLLNDVELLSKDVLTSDLNLDLKNIILKQLENIRLSLLNYNLFGIESIKEAFSSSIGTFFVEQENFKSSKNSKEVDRFGKILGRLSTLISIALNVKKLAAPFFKNLLE